VLIYQRAKACVYEAYVPFKKLAVGKRTTGGRNNV
jgi:hypothetical protein